MFLQLPQQYLSRQSKTSQPRFKRLSKLPTSLSKPATSHYSKQVNKTSNMDNSKQNLYYQTHLTKMRSACKLDETTIVSKYLGTIRKDYDDMNKQSRKEMSSMKLKRREIEFMKKKNMVFCQKRQELQKLIAQKAKHTNSVRDRQEDAKMQTKTLENIIVRMKKDQIFYKQFGRIRDEQLRHKMKDVKLMEEKLINEDQKLHKLNTNLQSCRDLYDKNRDVREKKFQDFSGKISHVRDLDRFLQERKERTYELQSIELNDTLDDKNIHMREIILAHKVADSLLESKVNTLIKRYSDTQGAFHLVKIKTGVSEPQFLTNKFFSYEMTSESLLNSISQNEQYVEELKVRRQELRDQYRQTMTQQLVLGEEGNCRMPSEWFLKQREAVIGQTNKNTLLTNQLRNWISRAAIELKQGSKGKNQSVDKNFKDMCEILVKQLNQNLNFNLSDLKAPTMGVCLKKMVKQKSAQQLSIRLRESQDMNDSNLIEQEYIKNSRHHVHKKAFNIKQFKRQSKE